MREYDALNRLLSVEHRDAIDAVFASFDYELDAAGNRTAVTEHDGRRVEYAYDEIYRLIGEDIFDPGAAQPRRTLDYTYDPVGNRLTRDDSAEGLTTYTLRRQRPPDAGDDWRRGHRLRVRRQRQHAFARSSTRPTTSSTSHGTSRTA